MIKYKASQRRVDTFDICTDDDILLLDPQNETEAIVHRYKGKYFDLTPKSGIYLNGFEVYDDIFYGSDDAKEKFISVQARYGRCADRENPMHSSERPF